MRNTLLITGRNSGATNPYKKLKDNNYFYDKELEGNNYCLQLTTKQHLAWREQGQRQYTEQIQF